VVLQLGVGRGATNSLPQKLNKVTKVRFLLGISPASEC